MFSFPRCVAWMLTLLRNMSVRLSSRSNRLGVVGSELIETGYEEWDDGI